MADWLGVDVSDATCSTNSCDRRPVCRGMCNPCYQRWYSAAGSEVAHRGASRRDTEVCSVEGCSGAYHCRGLCRVHYNAAQHASNRDRNNTAAKVNSRRYYLANRDRVLAQTRARQKANPEKYRTYARERYRANPEAEAAKAAARRARNPETYRKRDAEYARRHPERARLKTQRRRALKLKNGVYEVSPRDLQRTLARYDHRCAYCRGPLVEQFDWDHIVPLARGGHHAIGNLAPSCGTCNRSKHALTITEWRKRDRTRLAILAA